MGLSKPALDRVIDLSYSLLGLVSFFTTVSSELKAWTIPGGTPAPKAAGRFTPTWKGDLSGLRLSAIVIWKAAAI